MNKYSNIWGQSNGNNTYSSLFRKIKTIPLWLWDILKIFEHISVITKSTQSLATFAIKDYFLRSFSEYQRLSLFSSLSTCLAASGPSNLSRLIDTPNWIKQLFMLVINRDLLSLEFIGAALGSKYWNDQCRVLWK